MFDELIGIVERDLDVFSGIALERYFRAKFLEEHRYTRIGGWWDRKGENEIDLVCENELSETLDFYEVKIDPGRLRQSDLEAKVAAFLTKNPEFKGWKMNCRGLSLAEM